jgi:hypothetical protein
MVEPESPRRHSPFHGDYGRFAVTLDDAISDNILFTLVISRKGI